MDGGIMINKYLYTFGQDGFERAIPFNSPYSEKFAKSVERMLPNFFIYTT
jgi:hypothetical protein